jgi:hypothetical protein
LTLLAGVDCSLEYYGPVQCRNARLITTRWPVAAGSDRQPSAARIIYRIMGEHRVGHPPHPGGAIDADTLAHVITTVLFDGLRAR